MPPLHLELLQMLWAKQLAQWASEGKLRAAAAKAFFFETDHLPAGFSSLLADLAAGAGAFGFAAFTFICFWQFRHVDFYGNPHALDLAVIGTAMVGGIIGFLWWNAAPAQIFMGDTGALAIGSGLAALALVTDTQLLLPIIGGLFVLVNILALSYFVLPHPDMHSHLFTHRQSRAAAARAAAEKAAVMSSRQREEELSSPPPPPLSLSPPPPPPPQQTSEPEQQPEAEATFEQPAESSATDT